MVKDRPDSAVALEDALEGRWDWDLSTDQVSWSPEWKAMLGYADSEIGVSSNEWFDRVHPEDLIPISQALAIHLEDHSTHFEIEHRVLDRRGVYRWMRCRAAIIRDNRGAATRLTGSFSGVGNR